MNDASSGDRETERERKLPRTHNSGSQYSCTLMLYHTGYQVCGPQNGKNANFFSMLTSSCGVSFDGGYLVKQFMFFFSPGDISAGL